MAFSDFRELVRQYGLKAALNGDAARGLKKPKALKIIDQHRRDLARKINDQFNGTIAYGPLKGFKFSPGAWWSSPDRASMILGFYEQELLQAMAAAARQKPLFIDIGAADGYYGVGMVSHGPSTRSLCFEISEKGRSVIAENASLNQVSERVQIFGEANQAAMAAISQADRAQAIILIDIEGAEFDLLDDGFLAEIKASTCFIELHHFFRDQPERDLQALRARLEKFFSITELTMGARDLSVYSELQKMRDTERWLLCSEGRKELMRWWQLEPLSRSDGL